VQEAHLRVREWGILVALLLAFLLS